MLFRSENHGRYIEMWEENCTALPTYFKALRELKGLSRHDFAKNLGYTAAGVKKWETVYRIASASTWFWALTYYGYHPDYKKVPHKA